MATTDYTLPPPLFARPPQPSGHAACSGCGLCQLVCPAWRASRDVLMTPHGRAKAMQHGASTADLAASVDSCCYCGACEPVCPENMPIVDLTLALRAPTPVVPPSTSFDIAVSLAPTFCLVTNKGLDFEHASVETIESFLRPLRSAGTLVVVDGLMLRRLRRWLPGHPMLSLGRHLSRQATVRRGLRDTDLYVIDAASYNLDYEGNVGHYDGLRRDTGCLTNLDLQRVAMPADDLAHARWVLRELSPQRIVVENPAHVAIFETACELPVIHVAALAGEHHHA